LQAKRPGIPGKENFGENKPEPGLFTENRKKLRKFITASVESQPR
jgi:hypothetical protein